MESINTTLTHKIQEPEQTSKEKPPALVLLHGRGANEDDLLGLTEYFDQRLFCIAARAPFPFQSGEGYTWYDVLEVGRPEPNMFAESYQRLVQFLEDIKKKYPINPHKIFFLGFSMGTIMSYSLALTMPGSVAGVIANSGYIPEDTDLKFQWDKLKGKPFFVAHGLYDPVIPVQYGQRAKDLLREAGVNLTYREYEMAHQINEESLNDISTWLNDKIR